MEHALWTQRTDWEFVCLVHPDVEAVSAVGHPGAGESPVYGFDEDVEGESYVDSASPWPCGYSSPHCLHSTLLPPVLSLLCLCSLNDTGKKTVKIRIDLSNSILSDLFLKLS